MTDPTNTAPEAMFNAFVNGRLGKAEWTHEAHLITCWVALADRTRAETIDFLRDAIQTHNCGIGIENTDMSGYHETLTRYYVAAVAAAIETADSHQDSLEVVLAHPWCDRDAPLNHWSRERLFSVQARRGWVTPDLADLDWATP